MRQFTFITGNQYKADYLAKLLKLPVEHKKIDLDEIQTLDPVVLIRHKAKQAYTQLHSPVLVEDQALQFTALGGLPGPFIKFFTEKAGLESCCRMLDSFTDRSAYASSIFAYYDGKSITTFSSGLLGSIAMHPNGEGGFGWDQIFIPDGYNNTRAQLNEAEDLQTYLKIKPIEDIRRFLTSN